ncbi:MAG: Holliday junction resolvase RuvX [Anaerolineales bacterium]|nr:Holliday junction resolvase RuvX [Anaerolineales bacterium]
MRLIGIDPGDKYIGLAICDANGTAARPLDTVIHQSRAVDLAAIVAIAQAQEAEGFVVGLALGNDGAPSPQGRAAERFAEALREASGLPVWLQDEWGSSREAMTLMIQAGKRRRSRREQHHAAAAAAILQSYLDATPRETPQGK